MPCWWRISRCVGCCWLVGWCVGWPGLVGWVAGAGRPGLWVVWASVLFCWSRRCCAGGGSRGAWAVAGWSAGALVGPAASGRS
uniref:Uncharacterized protein n=1 Tax=Thermocrispum agreste TaxID=37925 RepID=A0A2W4JP21_9PSEU|nr:MAG: hypothetical protein DIU77_05685 [Thermocrispum agreste]